MGRVTPAFLSFDSFDMNSMSPKFSFDIFSTFKMAGTLNSIATLNRGVKWRLLTFQACNTFYYKFSFLFQVSKNWKETSQNTSQTSRITQTKSRSQTCHKVRNNQKTYQFEGFRKIFGRFYKFWTGNAESLTNIWMMKVSTYSCLPFQFLEIWKK